MNSFESIVFSGRRFQSDKALDGPYLATSTPIVEARGALKAFAKIYKTQTTLQHVSVLKTSMVSFFHQGKRRTLPLSARRHRRLIPRLTTPFAGSRRRTKAAP